MRKTVGYELRTGKGIIYEKKLCYKNYRALRCTGCDNKRGCFMRQKEQLVQAGQESQ